MNKYIVLFYLIINLLPTDKVFSQEQDPDTVGIRGINWFAYPFAFYSPETSLAIGAGGIISFNLAERRNTKPSSVTASGYYTINNQYDLTLIPEIYFAHDKYKLWLKLNYGKIFDYFYGIGNSTSDLGNDKYLQENFLVQVKFLPKIFEERLNIGVIYEFRYLNIADKRGNPFLESKSIIGIDGGINTGIGLIVSWDSRDNIFFPSTGGFYEASGTSFTKAFGSDYNYSKYVFDFRRFFLITNKSVLALQSYFMIETGSPPYYDLALIGGDRIMRGYLFGRFRDKIYYSFQSEYRIPDLVWRFGLVLFAGFGDVASKINNIEFATIKPTYGFGVRFRFDELQKLDLRADVGFGRGTSGVYFSVNQAF